MVGSARGERTESDRHERLPTPPAEHVRSAADGPPVDPDAEAVEACVNGDVERFGELVTRYKDGLVSAVVRIVGDHTIAEDLCQDAFVRAFTGLGGFRGQARFSTWLFGIAVNIARDFLRRKRREERARGVATEAATRREAVRLGDNEPLEKAIARDAEDRFDRAFSRLSPDYRVAFAMRVREGLSYDEISAMTDVAPATLRMRVWRAREALRENMGANSP